MVDSKKREYFDVEIIFADGTSEMLISVRREYFDPIIKSHPTDIIFVSKDGSEIEISREKNIMIVTYFTLDCKGHRKHTRPDIEHRNFYCIQEMEEEKEITAKKML
jgi:hypothetical protein